VDKGSNLLETKEKVNQNRKSKKKGRNNEMNGTIERPVEEQTESRGSAFTATTENPFFDGVFRQYHFCGGI
jgi:hypothetical protein